MAEHITIDANESERHGWALHVRDSAKWPNLETIDERQQKSWLERYTEIQKLEEHSGYILLKLLQLFLVTTNHKDFLTHSRQIRDILQSYSILRNYTYSPEQITSQGIGDYISGLFKSVGGISATINIHAVSGPQARKELADHGAQFKCPIKEDGRVYEKGRKDNSVQETTYIDVPNGDTLDKTTYSDLPKGNVLGNPPYMNSPRVDSLGKTTYVSEPRGRATLEGPPPPSSLGLASKVDISSNKPNDISGKKPKGRPRCSTRLALDAKGVHV